MSRIMASISRLSSRFIRFLTSSIICRGNQQSGLVEIQQIQVGVVEFE